jgi:tRNA (guanine-N7-)-methyltransferase
MQQNGRTHLVAADAMEFVPADYFRPLPLAEIFPRAGFVEVDLGCGDGAYLAALAQQNPDRNFLGIERLFGRVRSACHKILHADLTNARILRVEIAYAVAHLFPMRSVEVFHLMFPDPWPKRRHSRRRVVTDDFLASIHRALTPLGTLRIATDQTDYFREIKRLAARSPQFMMIENQEASGIGSTFEERFRQDKIEIHRLSLRKVSEGT